MRVRRRRGKENKVAKKVFYIELYCQEISKLYIILIFRY